MASVPHLRPLPAEEYALLEDEPGSHDELIEGERVLAPLPVLLHALTIEILKPQLAQIATDFASPCPLRLVRETGWRFRPPGSGADSVPAPDLMVIRDDDARQAIAAGSWFSGLPLVVVEVIFASERRMRRMQKIGLYQEMGVPYIFEIDLERRLIRRYTPDAEDPTIYAETDEMKEPFRIVVRRLFELWQSG